MIDEMVANGVVSETNKTHVLQIMALIDKAAALDKGKGK